MALRFCVSLAFIFSFASIFPAEARKVAVHFGGGDVENTSMSQFYPELDYFSQFVKKQGWEPIYLHDGGHSEDSELLNEVSRGKGRSFNNKSYEATLRDLESQIKNKELKSGDQLLIYLNTHGGKTETIAGHTITTVDGSVDTSDLLRIRALAEEQHVQLAIIDDTCYGGYSLKLSDSETCVVTSAGVSNSYGFESERLLEEMAKSQDLEKAFLDARTKNLRTHYLGQPQISTPAGKILFQKMQNLSVDFEREKDLKKSMDDPTGSSERCYLHQSEPIRLKSLQKSLGRIAGVDLEASPAWEKFSRAVMFYRKQKKHCINQIQTLKNIDKQCVKIKNLDRPYCVNISSIDITVSVLKELLESAPSAQARQDYKIFLETTGKIANSPEARKYFKKEKELEGDFKKLQKDVEAIGQEERILYAEVYSNLSQKEKGSNPCKKFRL